MCSSFFYNMKTPHDKTTNQMNRLHFQAQQSCHIRIFSPQMLPTFLVLFNWETVYFHFLWILD